MFIRVKVFWMHFYFVDGTRGLVWKTLHTSIYILSPWTEKSSASHATLPTPLGVSVCTTKWKWAKVDHSLSSPAWDLKFQKHIFTQRLNFYRQIISNLVKIGIFHSNSNEILSSSDWSAPICFYFDIWRVPVNRQF